MSPDERRDAVIAVQRTGADALLIELADVAEVERFYAEAVRRRAAGEFAATDIVPAARTLLLDGLDDPDHVASAIATWSPTEVAAVAGAVVEISVRFDGPDLADVASLWSVDEAAVIEALTGTVFTSAFCGFSPGFAYLTGLGHDRSVPRRATPRTAVPVGALGLAGPFAGVYPRPTPGGWQIVGTAVDAALWDVHRDPPALLSPGSRVRFVEWR